MYIYTSCAQIHIIDTSARVITAKLPTGRRTNGRTIRLPTHIHPRDTSLLNALNASQFTVDFVDLSRIIAVSCRLAFSLPPLSYPSVLSLLSSLILFFFVAWLFSPRFFSHAQISSKQKHEHGPDSGTWRLAWNTTKVRLFWGNRETDRINERGRTSIIRREG